MTVTPIPIHSISRNPKNPLHARVAAFDALLVPLLVVPDMDSDPDPVPLALDPDPVLEVAVLELAELNEVTENDTEVVPLVAIAQNFSVKPSAVASEEGHEDWMQERRDVV